jgi:hypothetical protein
MTTQKLSVTLDPTRVAEAKTRVGVRGISKYLDEALAQRLQHDRLVDLEAELATRHGEIPAEVQRRVDETPWPR